MERRISAGILAGGKSKRMGEDKARLWHGGETFLAHLLRELREFDEVLLSVEDRRAWADAPCRVVEDQLPDFGPVEGIYQLLRAARNPYVLVTAIGSAMPDSSGTADAGRADPAGRVLFGALPGRVVGAALQHLSQRCAAGAGTDAFGRGTPAPCAV